MYMYKTLIKAFITSLREYVLSFAEFWKSILLPCFLWLSLEVIESNVILKYKKKVHKINLNTGWT